MNRKVGVILSYMLMAVEIISTFLYTPFLIRSLGSAEYGIYQLIMSVTSYLALLDLGVGSSVVRYMSKYRADKDIVSQRKFLGVITLYYLIIGVIVIVAGTVVKQYLPMFFKTGLTASEISLAKRLFSVTMLTTAVSLATSGFANAVIAYEHFWVSKGSVIILTVFKIAASVAALKMGFSAYGVVMVNFVITLITRLIYVAFVLFKLKIIPLFRNIEMSFVKEIVSYSAFIFLQLVASNINALSDQVLLAAFANGASVIIAVYGVGAQVLQYFKTIGSHFTSVLMPGLVRMVEGGATGKDYEKEMIRISRLIFTVLGFVWTVFAVFGKDFICLWAGNSYSQAYFVALVLMFPTVFSYSQGVGYQLLQAMKKHKTPAIVQVISALLNIVLTVFLIKWNPLKGAVIGSFTALFLCELVVMNIMYKKQIGISLISYFKGMFKGILICMAVSAAAGFAVKEVNLIRFGWGGFILNCAVMCAIYGITMLLFGMNNYEKQLLLKPIKKILKLK